MAANTLFIPYKVIDIHTALKSFQTTFSKDHEHKS